MATKYDSVIVFGPTGAVGSSVAQEAAARGAKVWLAMRDTSKPIPGLDESKESFARVQADLSDPSSITKAVQESKAKAAFFYQLFGAQDGMKAAISSMKEAGIEYAVFLSSYTIKPDEALPGVGPDRFIPYLHARVELNLEAVGLAHTALRPGYFAYNLFHNFLDRKSEPWTVTALKGDDMQGDCIVPKDIGRVGGAVIVDRPSDKDKEVIYVYGPELLSIPEQVEIVKKVSGKEIKINYQDEETYRQTLLGKKFPPPLIDYFLKATKEDNAGRYPLYDSARSNVKDYSGHASSSFEGFVKEFL